MKQADVLIIGSGIAGLSFAIKVAEARADLQVLLLAKSKGENSNTARAQGGIAVVLDEVKDNFQRHIDDTLQAGKGLCDPDIVKMVVTQAPERLQELISWGTSFDLEHNGNLALGLEGGHSRHRIAHHRDCTGLELERKLIKRAAKLRNISRSEHYFAVDLLTEKSNGDTLCTGVKVLDTRSGDLVNFSSKICLLATGGSGMIFRNTTNPYVATADGVAMAQRAGAVVRNMNFIQFHPTALYSKGSQPLFLISEAVRGFGAHLINSEGERFVFRTDPRGELATRDIVSAAIIAELKRSGDDCVYLDCRHLMDQGFREHFPTIDAHCRSLNLNCETNLIPVVPAAHYQCGGIDVDQHSRTSINNLYASGECAHTGLHGANRLASNSLLEAVVFSHQASVDVLRRIDNIPLRHPQLVVGRDGEFSGSRGALPIEEFRCRLNEMMTYELLNSASIDEKEVTLEKLHQLQISLELEGASVENTTAYFELRNMLQAASLVVEHSLQAFKLPV